MFLPFSLIVSKSSTKSRILICSVIIHWLGTFRWNDCLLVSNRFLIPMHDSIIIKISVLSAWLYCFSLPFLQWYWIINCCFYQSTIHFENHYALYCQWHIDHLLSIHKWWWLQSTNHNQIMVWIGLFNNDSKLIASNNQED